MAYTASKLIAIAEAEIGYHEKASNSYLDSKTANSGNNCVLTIKDPAQSAYAGINSFKISGYGTGANAVITQEIDIN